MDARNTTDTIARKVLKRRHQDVFNRGQETNNEPKQKKSFLHGGSQYGGSAQRFSYGQMFVKQDSSASGSGETQDKFKSGNLSDSSDDEFKPGSEGTAIDSEVQTKQPSTGVDGNYANFAHKMMQKMGYEKGKGLGKHGEGRVDIVKASNQRGRRGLGLKVKGFEGGDDISWEEDDEPSAYETVDWMQQCEDPIPEYEDLNQWMGIGVRKLRIDDEIQFCSQETLLRLLACKSKFDELDPEEMRQARTRSNPYETIRGGIFLNRAAMKMANMDFVFQRLFTEPKKPNGEPAIGNNELLYFADVCAGPGGFSEYVLWKKKWNAKGFGFTLKGANDFKLEDFFAASPELFEPHYGVDGIQGDGDIMRRDNLEAFRKFVFDNTDGKGVHFVMGDGGFSVAGQENIQEILTKQLLLCQFLCALNVLREGGNFVCKTFDLFTPFSVGLIYLLYRVFDHVTLFKPVTSRPANSERYIVCKGLKAESMHVRDYLFSINDKIWELKNTDQDVNEVVPLHIIQSDTQFINYMKESNESLAIVQAKALKKIQAYAQNTTLFEGKQADMRKECLRLWGIPGDTRSAPKIPDPSTKFQELIKENDSDYFQVKIPILDVESLQKIKSVFDYRCMISNGERCFILSLGRSHVYKWDGKSHSKWKKVIDIISLELPKDTLVEAEIVQELKGEGKGQRKIESVHIVDVMWLGGIDLRNEHYTTRMMRAEMFVKAVHKPSRPDLAPLRTKQIYKLEELHQIFDCLAMKIVKGSGKMPRLCYAGKENRHLIPSGVYFIKTTQDPWIIALSRSQNRKYFYNTITHESLFEIPKSSIGTFKFCQQNRYHWIWEEGVKVHEGQSTSTDSNKISKDFILNFINNKITHK
ncbi:cap-specific mRNA (nucleoside-2'-O-)-methyltransferase 1-like [Ptychodera flava]|uniref:cap-specific mRNA (nucleoside-2'-O-)-methyltransferase 1-like n=1 Tax=Ptychodera flava TaxID=63121 RepID=UPI00396A6FEE